MDVHKMVKEIKRLNGLSDAVISVRYASYHEIVYAGDPSKLFLPEGYYYDKKYGITNRTGKLGEMYRSFVVRPK